MSRIYDALKQTENPLVRMIEDEQNGQPDQHDAVSVTFGGENEFRAANAIEIEIPVESEGETVVPAIQQRVEPAGYRIVEIQPEEAVPVLPFDGTDRRTAECYRILRTNILHHPTRPRVIAVTSAGPGEGKTTSAINLAGAMALKQDNRVLLVDGDLRHASVATMLGIDSSPGLEDVLTGRCSLREAVVQTANLENLYVLPAGRKMTNPAELLDSAAWKEMTRSFRELFSFTIVDTTPIGIVTDYDLIQVVCDGTILVVRPDHTDRDDFAKAVQQVTKGKLLGALVNGVEDWFLWRKSSDYGYYTKGAP